MQLRWGGINACLQISFVHFLLMLLFIYLYQGISFDPWPAKPVYQPMIHGKTHL